MTAEQYVDYLHLQPHPEGGFYIQNYCSTDLIPASVLPQRFNGSRVFSTAIYYLLQQGDFSAFHKIKSDECWHFYAGDRLIIHVIHANGDYYFTKLGGNLQNGEVFQFVVPAEAWFAVEPAPGSSFGLTGCTVAPGFDFQDFEMASKATLLETFPQHREVITRLCRQ